ERISKEKQLAVRCPFANAYRCPRYYQSLALLGESGLSTSIPEAKDAEILNKWESTEVWPLVGEKATSIMGSKTESKIFSNFCPEVSYDRFGLFAVYLCVYADEIDKETAEKWLVENGYAFAKDWRWDWANVEAQHFSQCELYSQLLFFRFDEQTDKKTTDEIFSVKPEWHGISIDFKKLFSHFHKWWNSRRKG
ncbi:MAG: hypothetical protein ABSG42_06985, partial [Nitrospirota bacterium]